RAAEGVDEKRNQIGKTLAAANTAPEQDAFNRCVEQPDLQPEGEAEALDVMWCPGVGSEKPDDRVRRVLEGDVAVQASLQQRLGAAHEDRDLGGGSSEVLAE